jgi:hypothetical protein
MKYPGKLPVTPSAVSNKLRYQLKLKIFQTGSSLPQRATPDLFVCVLN